jgi:hypothetical protein
VIPESVAHVRDTVASLSGVDVRLDGSSATGSRTALSDWDFDLQLAPDLTVNAIADAIHDIDALAVFWDPLSHRANLIVLLDGPIKIDLIAADRPNPVPIERWEVTTESLPRLDAHFWDWTLWLGAKQLRGQTELVRDEMQKMYGALLRPLGAARAHDIRSAIASYPSARDYRAEELHVVIDKTLQHQVDSAHERNGVIVGNGSS